jgi:hypothetical protein
MPPSFALGELAAAWISTLNYPEINMHKLSEMKWWTARKLDEIDNLLRWQINSQVSSWQNDTVGLSQYFIKMVQALKSNKSGLMVEQMIK